MTTTTELRQDPLTKNWVVIVPERATRPHEYRTVEQHAVQAADCPFCPGNEWATPPEVLRINDDMGSWRLRVVPNKYEVVRGDRDDHRKVTAQGFTSMAGTGRHEVIIETPRHDIDLAQMPVDDVRAVLEAYRSRYRTMRTEGWSYIAVFRNHGAAAGTSLTHPHSQIIATPVVPIQIRHRFDVARQYYDDVGSCLYLDTLRRELNDGRRIVQHSERFVAFQPFASAAPFETWIMPRNHRPSLGNASDRDLDDVAGMLRLLLSGLRRALGDPDYNIVIQSAPPRDEDQPYFVWYMRITPRLTTQAGFELGSGMRVNPSRPEETASVLRLAVENEVSGEPSPSRNRRDY